MNPQDPASSKRKLADAVGLDADMSDAKDHKDKKIKIDKLVSDKKYVFRQHLLDVAHKAKGTLGCSMIHFCDDIRFDLVKFPAVQYSDPAVRKMITDEKGNFCEEFSAYLFQVSTYLVFEPYSTIFIESMCPGLTRLYIDDINTLLHTEGPASLLDSSYQSRRYLTKLDGFRDLSFLKAHPQFFLLPNISNVVFRDCRVSLVHLSVISDIPNRDTLPKRSWLDQAFDSEFLRDFAADQSPALFSLLASKGYLRKPAEWVDAILGKVEGLIQGITPCDLETSEKSFDFDTDDFDRVVERMASVAPFSRVTPKRPEPVRLFVLKSFFGFADLKSVVDLRVADALVAEIKKIKARPNPDNHVLSYLENVKKYDIARSMFPTETSSTKLLTLYEGTILPLIDFRDKAMLYAQKFRLETLNSLPTTSFQSGVFQITSDYLGPAERIIAESFMENEENFKYLFRIILTFSGFYRTQAVLT